MNEEIWKPIKGLEGYYEVSNIGRVRSVDRVTVRHNKNHEWKAMLKGKIIAPHIRHDGYPFVDLYKEHKRHSFVVHRLVAMSFVPNPSNRPEVDHINTDRTDARACNLRWVNRSENNLNPITNKRMSEAGKRRGGKPVVQYDKSGNFIAEYPSFRAASKATGYHAMTISNNTKGIHINSKFNWKYGKIQTK
jgi:hypothetical protein